MAQIPRKHIEDFTKDLNALNADLQKRLKEELDNIDLSKDVAAVREEVIELMEIYLGPYTDMAATRAAEFYEEMREISLGSPGEALADSRREPAATAGAVRAFVQDLVDGKPADAFFGKLLDRAETEMKRSANRCIAYNARRDKKNVKYARVPSGADTCGFCIMLASRGAVYKDEELASHAHPHCDCRVVPDFGRGIEGYDPKTYEDMWKHPEKYGNLPDKGIYYDDVKTNFVSKKLSEYSMDPDKSPTKAAAWKSALGYSKEDASVVESLIMKELPGKKLNRNGYNGYGALYYTDVYITGKNGKRARVRTSWIVEADSDEVRLTSAYVKQRKGGAKGGD